METTTRENDFKKLEKAPNSIQIEGPFARNKRYPIKVCGGHLYVIGRLNGVKRHCLVDSGAARNLCSEAVAQALGPRVSKKACDTTNLRGITGASLIVIYKLEEVEIWLGKRPFKTDLYVVRALGEEVILGLEFLEKYNWTLSLEHHTMHRPECKVPLLARARSKGSWQVKVVQQEDIGPGNRNIKCEVETREKENFDGFFLLEPNEDIWGESGDDPPQWMVSVKEGKCILPVTNSTEKGYLSLPKDTRVATIENIVLAINQVDCGEEPDRAEQIIEYSKLREAENLTNQQKKEVELLLTDFNHIFALSRKELGVTHLIEHEIPLTDDIPVVCPYRPVPFHVFKTLEKEVQELIEAGVLEYSKSNFSSPAFLLQKESKSRLIVDFRKLNQKSIRSMATVPSIHTLISNWNGKKWFSTLDLKDGYYQVSIKEEHRDRIAFTIPSIGHLRYCKGALGLTGLPATFSSLMDKVLEGIKATVAMSFLDDVIVAADTFEEMIKNLRIVFERFNDANLKLNPKKCELFKQKVKFLGVYLTPNGVEVDKEKTDAIRKMPHPRTKKQVQRALGGFSWWRNFMKGFAEKAKGLTDTLRGEKFKMTEEAKKSFDLLKDELCNPPILIYANLDKEMIVYTDCSLIAMGGVLGQEVNGQFHAIAYASKVLTPTQQAYPSFKREFLALKHFIELWRAFLLHKPFTCYVDAISLCGEGFLKKTTSAVMLRWLIKLSEYQFTIKYRPGPQMELADLLSRAPPLPQKSEQLFDWYVENSGMKDKSISKEDFLEEYIAMVGEEKEDLEEGETENPEVDNTGLAFDELDCPFAANIPPKKTRTYPLGCQNTNPEGRHNSTLGRDQTINPEEHHNPSCAQHQMAILEGSQNARGEPASEGQLQGQGLGSFDQPLAAKRDSEGYWFRAQSSDDDLQIVKEWLSTAFTPSRRMANSFGEIRRKLWNQLNRLFVNNEALVCFKYYNTKSKKYKALIVVPKGHTVKVMYQYHSTPLAGHMGYASTLGNIRKVYFWPRMNKEILMYCQECAVCEINNLKYKRKPRAPLKQWKSNRINQTVNIDLVGPFTHRNNHYKYILTILDRFSRYCAAAPLKTQTSQEIAKQLLSKWVFKMGVPEIILSDQGANLSLAEVMKDLYHILGIQKVRTTAYHPETNGAIERRHKDLVNVLKKLVGENPQHWHQHLDIALFGLNSAISSSTGYSPHDLVFSYPVRVPADLVFSVTTTEHYKNGAHLKSANYYKFREIFDQVRSNINTAMKLQKRTYDRQANFTRYEEGDRVLIYRPIPAKVQEWRKFKNTFIGPFEIKKRISEHNYLVEGLDEKKTHLVVHFDHMRFLKSIQKGKATPDQETTGEVNSYKAEKGEHKEEDPEEDPEDIEIISNRDTEEKNGFSSEDNMEDQNGSSNINQEGITPQIVVEEGDIERESSAQQNSRDNQEVEEMQRAERGSSGLQQPLISGDKVSEGPETSRGQGESSLTLDLDTDSEEETSIRRSKRDRKPPSRFTDEQGKIYGPSS